MVYLGEGFLGDSSPVVVCPSDYLWIEQPNQVLLFCLPINLHGYSDVFQERLDILFGWLDEQLAILFPYIPSENIKPFCDRRDPSFFYRERQSSLS